MRAFRSSLVASFSALTLASAAAAQATPNAGRIRDPEQITGDPTGLRPVPGTFRGPRYPDRDRAANRTAAPVVAFVLDTLGRVEMQTVSFLNDSRREFEKAVCEVLPELRYEPLVIDGRKWRVLLVQYYAFNTWQAPDSAGWARSRALMRERQEVYATQPVAAVVPDLERRPHCDGTGGK